MAQLVLGGIGAAIGGIFGGVGGAELGFAVGTTVGGLLFPPKLKPQEAGRLKDLRVTGSGYGSVIPQIFGNMRMHGNIIWSTNLVEHHRSKSSGKGNQKSNQRTTYYTVSCAVAVCRGPIGRIKRIWAEDVVIYDVADTPHSKYTIRTYTGTETQNVDTFIANSMSDSPAYRGIAYVVFQNLDLSTWGNRIPAFSFEVDNEAGIDTTIGDIVGTLLEQVGLTSSEYTVTEGTDIVKGFHITQRGPLKSIIEDLLRCYKFDLVDVDGKEVLKKRGGNVAVTIPAGDLGCRVWQGGTSPPDQKVSTRRKQDLELPFRIDLVYYSPVSDFQTASQGAERYTKINLQDATTVQTTLTLTDSVARRFAETILYQEWTEREEFVVSIPIRYLYLSPADIINLTVGSTDSLLRVRIISMDVGLFGPLQLSCVLDDASVLTQTISGAAVLSADQIKEDYDTVITAWSGNALRDVDAFKVGIYVGLGAEGMWPGAVLYVSRDAQSTYQLLDTIHDPDTYGATLNALPAFNSTGTWDDTNYIDVNIAGGEIPSSTSDDDVVAGANACLVGLEIVKFGTITPLGGSHYRLTHLLRGRRGTDGNWGDHVIGDPFVMIEFGAVRRYEFGDDMRGKTIYLKAVSTTQTLADVVATPLVITGDEFKCYAPVDIEGTRDGPLNLTITWRRRARVDGALSEGHGVPLGEDSEAYEIDILNGVTIVRTLTAATPTVVYTAAQQVTDFGSAQPNVDVVVYQMGKYGRGYPGAATV